MHKEGRSIPESNVFARSLVWRMFRDAADEDYLVARLSARASLPHQFYWSAQQSLEKYLKCALLLNGIPVKNFGHNLVSLFDKVMEFASDLVPSVLCRPSYFPRIGVRHMKCATLTRTFIENVSEQGSPSVRYRHNSIIFEGYDLHLLDEVVFQIRRLSYPLDLNYGPLEKTFREVLLADLRHQPHDKMSFVGLKNSSSREICVEGFQWRNFSFFEAEALQEGKILDGVHASNSELSMDVARSQERRDAILWLLENAKFTREERDSLENYLTDCV